jgi:hypothetical protein
LQMRTGILKGICSWYEISTAVVNYLMRNFATPAYFQCPLQHGPE